MAKFYLSEDDPFEDEDSDLPLQNASHPKSPDGLEEALRNVSSLSSPSMSPTRPKKQVGWVLPGNEDDSARSPASSTRSRSPTDTRLDSRRSREHAEELRQGIVRIFSNHHSPPASRSLSPQSQVERHGQMKAQSHKPFHKTERSTHLRPKSVLRSGNSHPASCETSSFEQPDAGVDDVEGKARSSNMARHNADKLSKSLRQTHNAKNLNSGSGSSVASPQLEPGKRNRRQSIRLEDLYHNGSEDLALRQNTPAPTNDQNRVARPQRYRLAAHAARAMMGSLSPGGSRRSSLDSGATTPPELAFTRSAIAHPRSPESRPKAPMQSMSGLLGVSNMTEKRMISAPAAKEEPDRSRNSPLRRSHSDTNLVSRAAPMLQRNSSSFLLGLEKMSHKAFGKKKRIDIKIKNHIRETQLRQRYLLKLCHALMEYGAPTHRLEEYLRASARVLEIEAQFLYLPSCMIVSFDDSWSHTAEVRIVRLVPGIDLGKLCDTHKVYKLVVHDKIDVYDAIQRLSKIKQRRPKYPLWVQVLAYGVASFSVGPFAFQARLVDLPFAFVLGCLLGILRLFWAVQSDLYSAIFEVTSVIITSFISRAIGSIQRDGETLFCFSALAQSSIALILPGYILLCGTLELQSRSLVAGSIRMFYGLIYSLFIGFALVLGPALYSWFDPNANSDVTCRNPMPSIWSFPFVPLFAFCLMIINQAKWKQMPMMTIIAVSGFTIQFFSIQRLGDSEAGVVISASVGAMAISFIANFYSRFGDYLAALFSRGCEAPRRKVVKGFPIKSTKATADEGARNVDLEKQAHDNGNQNTLQASEVDEPSESSTKPCADTTGISNLNTGLKDNNDDLMVSRAASKLSARIRSRIRSRTSPTRPAPPKKVGYSLAASVMLPAIFILVPSSLSSGGSLLAGIQATDTITSNIAEPATSPAQMQPIALTIGYAIVQMVVGSANTQHSFDEAMYMETDIKQAVEIAPADVSFCYVPKRWDSMGKTSPEDYM